MRGLPEPVARYFGVVLKAGQRRVERGRLWQRGEFALKRGKWAPFTAMEEFRGWPPGFEWKARIRVVPLVWVHVRDSHEAGEGVMQAKLAGLIRVVDQRGTPEMAASTLLRWLAEAVWMPTALLPREGLEWEAVDETSARVSVTSAGTRVELVARFGATGEVERVVAERHRDAGGGKQELTPWEGRFSDYEDHDGLRIPRRGVVGWWLEGVWVPYWRGEVVRAEWTVSDA